MKNRYDLDTENLMLRHYRRLSEKDRRQYAAIECLKLGWGGKSYISGLFKLTRVTLNNGIAELENESLFAEIPFGKQRRLGGGRKKICRSK
jgi:hypothetical protein